MFSIVSLSDNEAFYTNRQAAIALVAANFDQEAVRSILQNVRDRIFYTTRGEEEDIRQEWEEFDLVVQAYEEELAALGELADRNGVYEATEQILNKFLGFVDALGEGDE